MRLKPEDIAGFVFCPFLYWRGGVERSMPPLTLFENNVRLSILAAEHKAMVQESYVNARKIGNAWERLWWPAAAEAGMSPKDTDKQAIKAALKFSSYCQYDVASPAYETLGTDVRSEVALTHGVLAATVDLIKIPIRSHPDIVMVDFKRKDLKHTQAANDLAILSTVYAFSGLKRPITYISIDLSESLREVKTVASAFRLQDIRQLGRNIDYVAEGIHKKIDYQSSWACESCNKCHFRS
jgi:hypothetical protein